MRHNLTDTNAVFIVESVHGLDNRQNEEISWQTSSVGFQSSIYRHCCSSCCYTGLYFIFILTLKYTAAIKYDRTVNQIISIF